MSRVNFEAINIDTVAAGKIQHPRNASNAQRFTALIAVYPREVKNYVLVLKMYLNQYLDGKKSATLLIWNVQT